MRDSSTNNVELFMLEHVRVQDKILSLKFDGIVGSVLVLGRVSTNFRGECFSILI